MSNSNTRKVLKIKTLLIVMFLFSGFCSFAQATKNVETTVEKVTTVKTESVGVNSEIDFMNWFMSSRQTQIFNDENSATSSSTSRKKQILSSGATPNKVLYRTFIKKIVNKDVSLA